MVSRARCEKIDWEKFDRPLRTRHFFQLIGWTGKARERLRRKYGKNEADWPRPVVCVGQAVMFVLSRKLDARPVGLVLAFTVDKGGNVVPLRCRHLELRQLRDRQMRGRRVSVSGPQFFGFDPLLIRD